MVKRSEERGSDTNYKDAGIFYSVRNHFLKNITLISKAKLIISNGINCMWRIWARRGGCVVSCWGNRRERDYWGDLGVDWWIILGWISRMGGMWVYGLDWAGPG